MVRPLLQTIIPQRLGRTHCPFFGWNTRQCHGQRNILGRRQPRHQMKALEDETDALAAHPRLLLGAQCGDIPSFQPVSTRIRAIEQSQQIEQGRLAGAGRPHHGHILATADTDIELMQGMNPAVPEMENPFDTGQFDQGRGRGICRTLLDRLLPRPRGLFRHIFSHTFLVFPVLLACPALVRVLQTWQALLMQQLMSISGLMPGIRLLAQRGVMHLEHRLGHG